MAATELPVNPATTSAPNPGQQLASCRPASKSHQGGGAVFILKGGPAQMPRKVQLDVEGCRVPSGKFVWTEQMTFLLFPSVPQHTCMPTACLFRAGMVRGPPAKGSREPKRD